MLTLEKAKELFGELPKGVLKDSFYQEWFLSIYSHTLRDRGEEYIKENRVMLLSGWEYIRTLV